MSSCSVAAADRHDPVTQYHYDQLELTSVGPFVLDDIKGNWLTLSPKLIKEIHELPVKLEQTNDEIYEHAKATRDSSKQRWGNFLILRAESYNHLSGQIRGVCSQLYNETGMGIRSFFPVIHRITHHLKNGPTRNGYVGGSQAVPLWCLLSLC